MSVTAERTRPRVRTRLLLLVAALVATMVVVAAVTFDWQSIQRLAPGRWPLSESLIVAITTAVISMAHNLNLKVIAEGVETERQLGFLKDSGCDEVQGYLFSKPVAPVDLERLIRRTADRQAPAQVAV